MKLIVANWKMNPETLVKAKKLFNRVKSLNAVICPPFVYLSLFDYKFLGAQDVFFESGAHTGEISVSMLKDLTVKYVIVGHSERRALGETDKMIEMKVNTCLKAGLKVILCVGEKKGEDPGKVVLRQLRGFNSKRIIIAYEPVWAIGTGNSCSKEKANKVLKIIRKKFNNKVLYGGSVNSKIVKNYSSFDGLLVGGASLDAKEFIKLVKNA